MAHFNSVTLLGRLTADPQERAFGQGKKVAEFRLAVSRPKKVDGRYEDDPNPLYIDCEAFAADDRGGLAGVVMNYARKGQEVLITGELKFDQWDDKASGQKRSKHKVWVRELQLLGRKEDGGDERPREAPRGNGRAPTRQSYGEPDDRRDNIPF